MLLTHSSPCETSHVLIVHLRNETSLLWNVTFGCSYLFIYLFIPFARSLACFACVPLASPPAHHAATIGEAVDSPMSTVLYTVPLSHQPQTITKALSSRWLAAIPPCWGFSSLPLFFFLWAAAFPAHCLCRWDSEIKQRKASSGSGWLWMHEVLGGAGEKKNGPNRSATPAFHVSQRQPGRARWKLAVGFRDTYL